MDIDFSAAMTPPASPAPPTDPDFSAAMIQKKRGRPPKKKPPASPTAPDAPSDTYIDIYNQDDIKSLLSGMDEDDIKEKKDSNIKGKLTAQELRFLALYFHSQHLKGKNRFTIDKAMIQAGYGNIPESSRYRIAREIVRKYEVAAPGAAAIFQKLGYGPVRVALGIIDHAENAPPTVSLAALRLAAQCQGMIDAPDAPNAGITINLNLGPAAPGAAPGGPPPAPGVFVVQGEDVQAQPRKPLQITR